MRSITYKGLFTQSVVVNLLSNNIITGGLIGVSQSFGEGMVETLTGTTRRNRIPVVFYMLRTTVINEDIWDDDGGPLSRCGSDALCVPGVVGSFVGHA